MKRNHSLTYSPNTTYFTTATITEFTDLFDREPIAQVFMDNLCFYTNKFAVSLHGFVIMPNHIHLLLTIGKFGNISQFMQRLKERSAKQTIHWCAEHGETKLLEIFMMSAGKYKNDLNIRCGKNDLMLWLYINLRHLL